MGPIASLFFLVFVVLPIGTARCVYVWRKGGRPW